MEIDRPIAIAFLLFVILVITIFFVIPEYREFRVSQQNLGKIEAQYNSKVAYYADIDKASRDLRVHQDGLEKIDNALPEKPSIADLVYFLQKKSGESGLIVKDLFLTKFVSLNLENSSGNLKEIIFSLNLLGTYPSLKNFLFSLETSARLFESDSISLTSATPTASVTPVVPAATTRTTRGANASVQPQAEQGYSFKLEVRTHSY
jgi:Tfp pilus assembly protein PilO